MTMKNTGEKAGSPRARVRVCVTLLADALCTYPEMIVIIYK